MSWRKLIAVMILLAVVAMLAVLATKESGGQPRLPLVNASAPCEVLVNPCLYMNCAVNGPFGGTDPDAGERDQRRIS